MNPTNHAQLLDFCDYLASRRDSILREWRRAVNSDPDQQSARSLTREQFNDHVPSVLDAFDRKLRSLSRPQDGEAADRNIEQEEIKHGLHRWQQGYRLQELVEEWGHLQLCLFGEVEGFGVRSPGFVGEAPQTVREQLMLMVNESIGASADQYDRMQREEAAGNVSALQHALDCVSAIERQRSALIHQAVHDLRNDVSNVSLAANLLGKAEVAEADRFEVLVILDRGVQGVAAMLGELMELARLEAGLEKRRVAPFDAAEVALELCDSHRAFAQERQLYLKTDGPSLLDVEGDATRVRRLLQNLLLNALKYTERGGVTVSWGAEATSWWIKVKDTGPGLSDGPRAPNVESLKEATASAKESDETGAALKGEASQVLSQASEAADHRPELGRNPGEGVGLSIVKRLCELLDGSLEVASSSQEGTTFRVVMPKSYSAGCRSEAIVAARTA